MDADLTAEGKRLADHWSRYGREQLDSYLIQEVEHPAINPQSVLVRSFLGDRLHPGRFDGLIEEELYYSACASFALLGQRQGWFRGLRQALGEPGSDDRLPAFLQRSFREKHALRFSVSDLFEDLARCIPVGFDQIVRPFEPLWAGDLAGAPAGAARPTVLELGCGSANDYRFWASYGLGALIDYTGIDVCAENIANARARFPGVEFETGDASQLAVPDCAYDVVIAFDLYEHLSAEGIRAALEETARVGRDELWLSLFNGARIPAHQIQPSGGYHWNLLSLDEIADDLAAEGYGVQVVEVAAELQSRFPGYQHYNREAFIVLAQRI